MTKMTSGLIIRPWEETDVIRCHSIATAASKDYAWSLKHYQSSLEASHEGWLVLNDINPVGCLIAQILFDTADLLDIQVMPEYQGKGIGSLIFQTFLQECRNRNAERILLEVRLSNSRAISFYSHIGFKKIAIRKGYYFSYSGVPQEDAVILELIL